MTEDHKVRCSIHLLGAFFFFDPHVSFSFVAKPDSLLLLRARWNGVCSAATAVGWCAVALMTQIAEPKVHRPVEQLPGGEDA